MRPLYRVLAVVAAAGLLAAADQPRPRNFFERLFKPKAAAQRSATGVDLQALGRWLDQGGDNPLPAEAVVGRTWDRVCVVTPDFSDWAVETCTGAPVPFENLAWRDVEWTLLTITQGRAKATQLPKGDLGYADPGCTCFDREEQPAFTRAFSPEGFPQTRLVAGDNAANMNALPPPPPMSVPYNQGGSTKKKQKK